MNKMPLVSVIIITFNRAQLLKDAIESVMRQRYGAVELIVYDDGSTDTTEQVVKKYQARFLGKIVYLKGNHTGILGKGRNEGFKIGQGEYFIFLDDDDIFTRDSVRERVEFMQQHPDIDWAICGVRQIEKKKSKLAKYLEKEEHKILSRLVPEIALKPVLKILCVAVKVLRIDTVQKPWNEKWQEYAEKVVRKLADCGFERRAVVEACCGPCFIMGPGSVIFRRAIIEKLGGFRENMSCVEDLDLYARAAMQFKLGLIDRVLFIRRRVINLGSPPISRSGEDDYKKQIKDMLTYWLSS